MTLVEALCAENHDVAVIDTDRRALEEATSRFDIMGFVGNGASVSTLEDAGIYDTDLFIAMTGNDELNILSCIVAHKKSGCHTIVRIHNPEYSGDVTDIGSDFGLSMVVNSELMASVEVSRILRFPTAQSIETFSKGIIEIIRFKLPEDSPINNVRISELPFKEGGRVLICAVERGDEVFIPRGDFKIKSQDVISVVATKNTSTDIFSMFSPARKKVSKCMIIGGGGVSYYLAKILLSMKMHVTIMDKSIERCHFLSDNLKGAVIINADAVNPAVLEEEGIKDTDAFLAMTNIDETNLLLSLFAKKNSEAKLITKVHRLTYDDIIKNLDLDSIICPKNIVADNIIQYVRSMENATGSNVETMYHILGNKVEALEFVIRAGSPVIGKPLSELKISHDVLVAAIRKGKNAIIPEGSSVVDEGDSVVVVTTRNKINDISEILEKH